MNNQMCFKVRYKSSPNIAWVKYWGKYDENYILPINDSLGLTLNADDLHTVTDIQFSDKIEKDKLFLNDQEHPVSKRIIKMFQKIKMVVYERKYKKCFGEQAWSKFHFDVRSINSFPTASGMASSASGLACLAAALNGIFDNVLSSNQLSELARLGSGSASRSICGGLVRWKGVSQDHFLGIIPKNPNMLQQLSQTCISQTVVPSSDLKDIKVLILLANNKQKQISSTSGMQQSVSTSQLITLRNQIASKRIQKILSCINTLKSTQNEDKKRQAFNEMSTNIMQDSNQFHAICLDTHPPIFYLNDFSKQIMSIVHNILNKKLSYQVAYTFDAGPHAFLFMHSSVLGPVLRYFVKIFNFEKEGLSEKVIANLKNGQNSGQQEIQFKEYQGEIVKAHGIIVSDVGNGSEQLPI